jgi:serine/threonine protein kinase
VIHRDLKTANLLVNNVWTCTVADFGIATVNPDKTSYMTCIGTPHYMAPEVLLENKYSEKADVYSFGIVLAELFTGLKPYAKEDKTPIQLMNSILNDSLRPTVDALPLELQQLISNCWNIDPKLRPSFVEILLGLRRLQNLPAQNYDTLELGESIQFEPLNTGISVGLESEYLLNTCPDYALYL